MYRVVLLALIISSSFNVHADTVVCNGIKIKHIYVEGDRDDNFYFQNKLAIEFNNECAGKLWGHLDLSNPIANQIISIALSAKALDKTINIGVNTSTQTALSNQLAYIGFN